MKVPPIIDQATFDAAQTRARLNTSQSRRNRKYEYLLINKRLRCGQCGCAMAGHPDPRGTARYRCTRRPGYDIITAHTKRSVAAPVVEAAVWAAVERVLRNPALIAQEVARRQDRTAKQRGTIEYERTEYHRQLATLDKALARWEAAYIGEGIDLADFKAKRIDIAAQRASLLHEISRLDAEHQFIAQREMTALTAYCRRVTRNLRRLTLAERQQALEALNIAVVWHPDQPLAITGSIPMEISNGAIWLEKTRGSVLANWQEICRTQY